MGLSFAGPDAPPPRRPRLLPRAGRYLLAALCASALTAIAAGGMMLTTGPAWCSYLLQPFAFFLLPGFALEIIPRNAYFFSTHGVLYCSVAFYFFVFARLLRHRKVQSFPSQPES